MAVRRGHLPIDRYTVLSNEWARDDQLHWKAKGLLLYIAGHAPGYQLTMAQMISEGADGREAVQGGLRELEAAGYLRRSQQRDPQTGQLGEMDYDLVDPADVFAVDGLPVDGKPVSGPDLQEQVVSPAQTADGFAASGKPAHGDSLTKKTTRKKTKEDNPTARATRLPDDFQPDAEMRAWFVDKGLPKVINGLEEHDKFRDYWRGKPGAAGTKIDWPATWRNWMREAAQRAQGGGRYAGRPGTAAARPAFKTAAEKTQDKNDLQQVKSRIFDEIVKQEHLDVTKAAVVQEVSRRADEIVNQLATGSGMTTCRPDEYTGPDRAIVDAVWYEGTPPQEVTAA